ncbi:acyl-CoA dehydratase activase-related protein [[Collinsella] massiliensis]|uniref:acyl-CoA dehydratase activase-related protein n=1 Tax=[Collinsella] massiliensis TaxID=1232426 RepID=UPI001F129CB8|nr:acyl-CoA dehydratase activase-related protein [[Collinsella] massiliensis]
MSLEFGQRADLVDVRRVGIPRALLYYRYGIAWRTFFEQLGRDVVLDEPSDRGTLEVGDRLSVDECCLASKLFLGHVSALIDAGVDAVFVPSLMGYGRFDTFCTKFQALPDLAANAFAVAGKPVRIISLRIDELRGETEEAAFKGLAARFGASRKEAARAYKAARTAQRSYDEAMAREQEKLVKSLGKLPAAERPLTILVAAHPYVSHDPFVGGVVEDALRDLGACVLFADETDRARALKRSYEFSHSIPWMVNRELIGSILMLHEHIDGIVLMSAYPCGPDSMADDAIERCIKGKPILTLTVDAQAGTAGVETRVESFVDILSYQKKGGYLNA